MTFVLHSSVAPKSSSPAQRTGPQFLKSRRSAFIREGPSRGNLLYTQALQLARLQDQEDAARTAFEECCKAEPDNTKVLHFAQIVNAREQRSWKGTDVQLWWQAWVSWAQFEKRVKKHHQDRFQKCRQVLQQGLTLNRTSAALIQV